MKIVEDENEGVRLRRLREEGDVLLEHLLLARGFALVAADVLLEEGRRLDRRLEDAADHRHDVYPRERDAPEELRHFLGRARLAVVLDDFLEELRPGLERFDLADVLAEERGRTFRCDGERRARAAPLSEEIGDVREHGALSDSSLARHEENVLLVLLHTHCVHLIEDHLELVRAANHGAASLSEVPWGEGWPREVCRLSKSVRYDRSTMHFFLRRSPGNVLFLSASVLALAACGRSISVTGGSTGLSTGGAGGTVVSTGSTSQTGINVGTTGTGFGGGGGSVVATGQTTSGTSMSSVVNSSATGFMTSSSGFMTSSTGIMSSSSNVNPVGSTSSGFGGQGGASSTDVSVGTTDVATVSTNVSVVTTGVSSTTGGASCPPTDPGSNVSCNSAGLLCDYGSDSCVCENSAQGSHWLCNTCPTGEPMDGANCNSVGAKCDYGATQCDCNGGHWNCNTCPTNQPMQGGQCFGNGGLDCAYGSTSCTCQAGHWNCLDACPPSEPAPGATCASGLQKCQYGADNCICIQGTFYCN